MAGSKVALPGRAGCAIRAAVYCGAVFLSLWAVLLHLSTRITFDTLSERALWDTVLGLAPALLIALGLWLTLPGVTGRGAVIIAAGFFLGTGVFLTGLPGGGLWPNSLANSLVAMRHLRHMYLAHRGPLQPVPFSLLGTVAGGALAGAAVGWGVRLGRCGLARSRVVALAVAWSLIDGAAWTVCSLLWFYPPLALESEAARFVVLGLCGCFVGMAGGGTTVLLAWPSSDRQVASA